MSEKGRSIGAGNSFPWMDVRCRRRRRPCNKEPSTRSTQRHWVLKCVRPCPPRHHQIASQWLLVFSEYFISILLPRTSSPTPTPRRLLARSSHNTPFVPSFICLECEEQRRQLCTFPSTRPPYSPAFCQPTRPTVRPSIKSGGGGGGIGKMAAQKL